MHEIADSVSEVASTDFVAMLQETVRSKKSLQGFVQQRLIAPLQARADTSSSNDVPGCHRSCVKNLISGWNRSLAKSTG